MSDCLFCLVRRRDRSLSRSVVLILHEAAAQMLYIHWTPPPGTGRAQLPNAVAICKWERRQLGNISDVKGRLIPKTCSCLPGNVSHVRLWVFMKGGEGRGGWVVKGGDWTCLVANICLCFPPGASFQRAAGLPHRGSSALTNWKHIVACFVC